MLPLHRAAILSADSVGELEMCSRKMYATSLRETCAHHQQASTTVQARVSVLMRTALLLQTRKVHHHTWAYYHMVRISSATVKCLLARGIWMTPCRHVSRFTPRMYEAQPRHVVTLYCSPMPYVVLQMVATVYQPMSRGMCASR